MSEKRLITSQPGARHHTLEFTGGYSHRRILPGKDGGSVKVTEFHPDAAAVFSDVHYDYDETVVVHAGRVRVWQDVDQSDAVELGVLGVYVVPMGAVYCIEALEAGCILVCLFSAAAVIPDDK